MKPSDILLCAINARYQHTAFGLLCLRANLRELKERSRLYESTINQQPRTIVEEILAAEPRIVALSAYIWNITLAGEVAALLKKISPEITIISGGPEIGFAPECHLLGEKSDYIINGEGELAFYQLCRTLMDGEKPHNKYIKAAPLDLSDYRFPYADYSDEDIRSRFIYVEASRGCPFSCHYCMSSLDRGVRYFERQKLFAEFDKLIERGARSFKFIDRSFNIDIPFTTTVIEFFLHKNLQLFLHFELIPERMPSELLELLKKCPPSMIQFEIGIQTFNPAVAKRIERPLDGDKICSNLALLRRETAVHIHADLIAGLPGEDLESFATGFDNLLALAPHEIQVGILKRLSGTAIDQHSRDWDMRYCDSPPYEVVQTAQLSFNQLQEIQRFARFWNITVNNGNFASCAPLIWEGEPSPFHAFAHWSGWLYDQTHTTTAIALPRLAQLLLHYLSEIKGIDEPRCRQLLIDDFRRVGRSKLPPFLNGGRSEPAPAAKATPATPLRRQRTGTIQ